MNNVKSITSSHNKTVISKSTNSDKDKNNCYIAGVSPATAHPLIG